MFTGIVEYTTRIYKNSENEYFINKTTYLNEVQIGDSISVNGICLTVSKLTNDYVYFDILQETLRKTNIQSAENVNIELSKKIGHRNSGHDVNGHIHTKGKVVNIIDESIIIETNFINSVKYKDSIAINGISLTVCEIDKNTFKINVIPHTKEITNMKYIKIGDYVNIEFNINICEKPHVYIVHSSWHYDIMKPCIETIQNELSGMYDCTISSVHGGFEIPLEALNVSHKCDLIVCIGIILKGETLKFECDSYAITNGLMQVQLTTKVPIVNHILCCQEESQAVKRMNNSTSIISCIIHTLNKELGKKRK